jgi:protein subunit release factor B
MRELIFSVTLKDCEVQTFRAGGNGGQNQNKRNTGVRIIHRDSGARAEAREHRTQYQNKRAAFRRMTETKEFKLWLRMRAGESERVAAAVDQAMWPVNIKTEYRINGQWVEQ